MSERVPPWRRPRRLRRQITAVLAITALIAVLLFGVLNYVAANRLLVTGTTDQLQTVAASRARSIELGANRFLGRIATTAADRSVVTALEDFTAAVEGSGSPADLNEQDRFLKELADTYGDGDLVLVDAEGTIVYSARDRLEPGTSLVSGALADTTLATLVLDQLDRVRAGTALASNVVAGNADGTPPALFSAASIRDGNQVVGTVVIELPVTALDQITTAGVDIDDAGLGDGQSYVVAANRLLQSTPESWLRDPEAYLDDIDDEEVRAMIASAGSPAGVHPIDTDPVRTALEGEQFVGTASNALGQSTYASAVSIDMPGVEWVMVTEAPLSDVRRPLFDYLIRMAIVVAIVLPIAAMVGFVLARRLTRPIPASVAAARAVADGERELDLPALGNDEFGDLGRRLQKMAGALARQERALDAEYERKRQLLLSVLPPHLVRDDGRVSGTGDQVDVATVVSVAIDADAGELDDDELTEVLASAGDVSERLASERSIDRVRVSADRGLYVAGAGTDDEGADVGLDFAAELAREMASIAEETDVSFTVHVGVSTGAVATGVLTRGSLTFAAWGEPVRRALAISALSKANEVLVDAGTIASATDRWVFVEVDDVVDLDGEAMDVRALQTGVDAIVDAEPAT